MDISDCLRCSFVRYTSRAIFWYGTLSYLGTLDQATVGNGLNRQSLHYGGSVDAPQLLMAVLASTWRINPMFVEMVLP